MQTNTWWRQATADLETARANLAAERYYAATWFCQQASEKALKALYMQQRGSLAPKIHDLVRLANLVGAPSELHPVLATLNDAFAIVRYPDSTGQAPVDAVTASEASTHIKMADGVLAWVGTQLT